MRPVAGELRHVYRELELAFEPTPDRAGLEADAKNADEFIRRRAELFLKKLDAGQPLPAGVRLPMAAVRIGDDLTLLAMGGEVVVDYARAFKRLHADGNPWAISERRQGGATDAIQCLVCRQAAPQRAAAATGKEDSVPDPGEQHQPSRQGDDCLDRSGRPDPAGGGGQSLG